MKDLYWRLFGYLARLAGGRPDVVVPLARGLERAATGKSNLIRQQSSYKTVIPAETLRTLILVIAALGSIGLCLVMALSDGERHPNLGVLILVGAHWFFVGNSVLGRAGPSLLSQDDGRILGWWPLSRRELLQAKLAVLLKPALELTAALSVLPLAAYAVTGDPPVIAAAVFALGLLLQTLAVAGGVALLLAGVVRLFGQRRAERLAGLIADGNAVPVVFFLPMILDDVLPWIQAHPWSLYGLPPVWFAAWGDLSAGPLYWRLAGLGLLATGVLFAVGLRWLMPSGAQEAEASAPRRRARFDPAGGIARLLRPAFRGREGWVVHRLMTAHLRDDWRFTGAVLSVPVLMAMMFVFLPQHQPDAEDLEMARHSAIPAANLVMFMMFGGQMMLFAATFSSQPEAMWQVALADLDADRVLAAARRMVMALLVGPLCAVYAVKALTLGASWHVILRDAAILVMQFELLMLLIQPRMLDMPFSRRYRNEQSTARIVIGLMIMGIAILFLILDFVYAAWLPAHIAIWIVLPLLWFWARRRLRHRVAGLRLGMDAVVP